MKVPGVILTISAVLIGAKLLSDSEKKPVKSILFVGDSNTFNLYSYAHIIKAQFPNVQSKIIAKVGEKTDWMFENMKRELANKKYDAIVVLGGSNDIYALNSNDSAKRFLSAIYFEAKKTGARVIAITAPCKDFFVRRTPEKQNYLFDLNRFITANKISDFVIDFWKITRNRAFFIRDDGYLHAQRPAHVILAKQVIDLLKLK